VALAASEDTNPSVRPSRGTPSSVYRLSFTLRETPGHPGVVATSYRIGVAPPAGSRSRCAPPAPPVVDSGHAGDRARIRLRAPARGWCTGRYRISVFLVRGPYCPPNHDEPCPEFATRETPAG